MVVTKSGGRGVSTLLYRFLPNGTTRSGHCFASDENVNATRSPPLCTRGYLVADLVPPPSTARSTGVGAAGDLHRTPPLTPNDQEQIESLRRRLRGAFLGGAAAYY